MAESAAEGETRGQNLDLTELYRTTSYSFSQEDYKSQKQYIGGRMGIIFQNSKFCPKREIENKN